MKRTLLFILLFALTLSLFAACGSKDPASLPANSCRVILSGSGQSDLVVEKGSSLSQPADPTKEGHIFGGWYTDSSLSQKAIFPMVINEDTTLYAEFYTYQTAFMNARENTIGASVPGYEYDYTLTVSAGYNAVSLNGKTVGKSKYSSTGEVSFYDEHTNSGILFYDGTKYQIRRSNTLQKISLDENDLLRDYSVEEVDASYRFDTSSFAKALFEYENSQLKSIEATQTPNEYKLNTSFNASKGIALAGKVLNNSIVKRLISGLPETNVDTGMYVTFSGGEIKTYRYEMNISVTSVQFSLVYDLSFKNVGSAAAIAPKTFSGLSLTPEEITATGAEVTAYLNDFISQAHSGYDFKIKTGVDFPSKNEINSTFKGSALRKIDNGTVYFHNDIEIDSDYKNADLYKAAEIADVHIKRTRLANGDVYNIEKRALLTDKTTLISPYAANDTDSYYLFRALAQVNSFTFVQKMTKGTTTTYSVGIAKADAAKILTWLNGELDLDPLGKATQTVKVFGSFNEASVVPDEIEITVVVKDGVLDSVSIVSDGTFQTAFANSRDFTETNEADFSFDYSITVNKDGATFEPYTDVKNAK